MEWQVVGAAGLFLKKRENHEKGNRTWSCQPQRKI